MWGKLGVVTIEDKMIENCLRWFDHVHRKPLEAAELIV